MSSQFYRFQTGLPATPEPSRESIPGATFKDRSMDSVRIQTGASTQAVLQTNIDALIIQRDAAVRMANDLLDPRTGSPRPADAGQHARLVKKVEGLTATAEYQVAVGERQLAAEAEGDGGAANLIAELSAQHEAQQRAQTQRADAEIEARAGLKQPQK